MKNKNIVALIFMLCIVTDSAYCLRAPITADGRIRHAEIRALFEQRAKILGGKCTWDEIIEGLVKEIGFEVVPISIRVDIQEV